MHCGAGQPGSLGERERWRPLSTLALVALLLLGAAAAAGAAALGSHKAAAPRTLTVAQAPVPASTATTTPARTPTLHTPALPGATATPTPKVPPVKTPKGGTEANTPLFPNTSKPPKIPSTTATPHGRGTGTGTGTNATGKSTTGTNPKKPSKTGANPGGEGSSEGPSAILLDTNAASTYNPYSYPESGFGDPALAIDGEVSTAWTAPVQPSSAPRMAEGLLLNLKTPTKVGSVELITDTPGMTVQLYGATGASAPATITEPGWIPLSTTRVLQKHKTHAKLKAGTQTQALRYLLVWLVKAPASAVGTPQAPGHVDLNEVELFPPAG